MDIWGVNKYTVERIAGDIGVKVDAREIGPARVRAKFSPAPGNPYTRTSSTGRKVNGLCTHGFELIYRMLFIHGATRIKSPLADVRFLADFEAALPIINAQNIGSLANPMTLAESCSHD